MTRAEMLVDRVNISMMSFPMLPGKSWNVLEVVYLALQFCQLIIIQQVFFFPAAEDQVNILVSNCIVFYMVHHAPERCNPGTGADQEKIFIDHRRQRKYSLRPAKN